MAGPWEQYQTPAPAAPEAGPWGKYSSEAIPGERKPASALAKFGRAAASLADVALGDVPAAILGQVTFPVARALGQTPEEATALRQKVTPFTAPVGKLFGVEQTPEYQQEASRRLMTFVGQNLDKGSKWLSQQTGLPEADVQNMVGTLTMAAPQLVKAGKTTITQSQVGNVLAPKVEQAVNALNAARQKTAEAVTGGAANVLSGLTGKSAEAFKQAYKAGKEGDVAFLESLRKTAPPDEVLSQLKEGVANIQRNASEAYQTAKTGWAADQTSLDFNKITDAYDKVKTSLQQRGMSKIGAAEQRIVDEIGDVLKQWQDNPQARTALDLDALKQRLDAIYPESPQHTQAQRAVMQVRNAVKDEITGNVKGYADAMKDYEQQLLLLRDINKALGTSDKIAKETAINKALSALKTTPSAQFKRGLVNELESQGGVNVMPGLAGQELAPWTPSSGVGKTVMGGGLTAAYYLHHPELAFVLPFTSPRLMGESLYGVGRTAGAGRGAVNALSQLPPEVANALAAQAASQQQNR